MTLCETHGNDLCASASALDLGYKNTAVIKNITFNVYYHEIMAISGESGSGKSTLLKYLRGDPRVQRFSGCFLLGEDENTLHKTSKQERRHKIGYISQNHQLILRSTVAENVLLAILYEIPFYQVLTRTVAKQFYERVMQALSLVGMESYARTRCDELSGGQKQRVSIARALVQEPTVLMADEPIASLDFENAERVFSLFEKIKQKAHTSIMIILHQKPYIERCDGQLHFTMEKDFSTAVYTHKNRRHIPSTVNLRKENIK